MFLKTKEKLNEFSISHFKAYTINFIEKRSTLGILPSRGSNGWKPMRGKILPWEYAVAFIFRMAVSWSKVSKYIVLGTPNILK